MDKLIFYLECCHRLTAIPMRVLNAASGITLYTSSSGNESEWIDAELLAYTAKKAMATPKPFLVFESDVVGFGVLRDVSDSLVVAGPVLLRAADSSFLRRYAQKHKLSFENMNLTSKSLAELSSLMALLYTARTGEMLNESEVYAGDTGHGQLADSEVKLDEYTMKSSDEEIVRMSYANERNYFRNIREGIVDAWTYNQEGAGSVSAQATNVGKMASAPIKQFEYMLCTGIALAARAAIEGGLEPAKSYAYSDLYLQRLEKCKTVDKMLALHVEMRNEYARQVKKAKERRSKVSYVEKAKNFIGTHLNKPYELTDIASELKVSKVYLSKKFNAEVGMSVMRYARKKRIETAANMLKYSNESISNIANYLCFQSQSHFGAAFKEIMGTTPQKYRESEQPIERAQGG